VPSHAVSTKPRGLELGLSVLSVYVRPGVIAETAGAEAQARKGKIRSLVAHLTAAGTSLANLALKFSSS
jgi:hypothetical protein